MDEKVCLVIKKHYDARSDKMHQHYGIKTTNNAAPSATEKRRGKKHNVSISNNITILGCLQVGRMPESAATAVAAASANT